MALKYKVGNPEASSFIVPNGEYTVRVEDAMEKTSNSGNDMIELQLRIIRHDKTEGPAMKDWLVFSEKAYWRVDQFLIAAGKHPGEGEEVSLDADELIGVEVGASLVQEKTDEGTNMRVKRYNSEF